MAEKSTPLVSVIVPCYNQAQFLDEAIDSVFAQTYSNIEIIVVNDASTDAESVEILSGYTREKTTVIHHKENKGLSEARNTGIQAAKGEYILPLDSDDRIAPTYIEKAIEVMMNNSNIGIVSGKVEFFGDQQGIRNTPDFSIGAMLVRNLLVCTSLFRRADWEKVKGYKSRMKYGFEDYDFWLSILELGREVHVIPEVMFYYRKRKQIATKQSVASMDEERITYSLEQLVTHHGEYYQTHLVSLLAESNQLARDKENLENIVGEREEHIRILKNEIKSLKTKLRESSISSIFKRILP